MNYTKIALSILLSCGFCVTTWSQSLYTDNLKEAKKIYKQMSLEEKIGQLIQPSYVLLANSVSPDGKLCKDTVNNPQSSEQEKISACGLDQIGKFHLGSVLSGGGPYFNDPTLKNWADLNELSRKVHKQHSPKDPLLLTGNDAVHGNMHVQGAVLFPHNIGLGVTHDPELMKKIGDLVGKDSLASGFNWVFAPTLAIAEDLRWGRAYESFGQEPALVKKLGKEFIEGIQDIHGNKMKGPVATAKHFIGDGTTQYGFDEGDDQFQGSEKEFWIKTGAGYEGAVQANVGTLMASYSAISGDDTRMHFGGKWDILNTFKKSGFFGNNQHYVFDGLVVSDWNGATRAAYFYNQLHHTQLTLPEIFAKSFNAGVDIFMLGQGDTSNPFDSKSKPNFTKVSEVFDAIRIAYQKKLISKDRLENAVTHILAVKLAMQAETSPINYEKLQQNERELALRASEESLVLLKNNANTLPVTKAIQNVVFVGPVNDLGLQNGGWSVNWQGQKGDQYFTGKDKISSGATTLSEGIQEKLGSRVNYYFIDDKNSALPNTLSPENTIAISVVAEVPYAEFMGDIGNKHEPDRWYDLGAADGYNLYLGLPQSQFLGVKFSAIEAAAIQKLRASGIKVITVVYSGRPLVLSEGETAAPFQNSDAVIAAFLPGTLGGKAIANAVFGDYRFKKNGKSNTLTFPWPRNMNDVENQFKEGCLFDIGFGLED